MTVTKPILCLDTSTGTARVALVDGAGAALAQAEATADRHSAHVLKLCDEVLRAVGLTPSGLAAIACGAGPGSFTGLRVGLSVAKGLALATGTPLLLVSSLETLALDLAAATPTPGAWHVVPCIDAGKGEVYASAYAVDAAGHVALGGDPWRLAPAALAERLAALSGPVVVAGNGAERHAELLDELLPAHAKRVAIAGPTALSVARLALPRLARGDVDDLETSVPLYGRAPDITTKKVTTNAVAKR
jgi:tRNA threonylcarbamoyladenosine biosynthesis protein TsaB